MSMKNWLTLALLILLAANAGAQETPAPEEAPKKFDKSKLVFGGNIGATFGDFTFIQFSPQVGYAFTKNIVAGAGVNFSYSSQKFRYFNGDESERFNYGYAGLNVFTRVYPVNFLFLSAQPELNYNWGKIKYKNPPAPDVKIDGAFIPTLLLGGGVAIPMGNRGQTMLSLQYDVLQNNRSPYGKRAFFNIGFSL